MFNDPINTTFAGITTAQAQLLTHTRIQNPNLFRGNENERAIDQIMSSEQLRSRDPKTAHMWQVLKITLEETRRQVIPRS